MCSCLVSMVLFPSQRAVSSRRWVVGCRVRPRVLHRPSVSVPAAFSCCCAGLLISLSVGEGLTGTQAHCPVPHECPGFPQPLPFLPLDLVSWFSVPECQDRVGWHQGLLGLGMHTNAPSSRQTPCPGRVVGKQEQVCLSHPPAAPQRDP